MDLSFVYDLNAHFIPGVPADEQERCIDHFFDPDNWPEGFCDNGTDEEVDHMITTALANCTDLTNEVREMMKLWKEEGF